MSIDTRLRAGLRAEVEQTGPVDVVDSWAEVMRRADRDSTRRRTRVAALAVAAVPPSPWSSRCSPNLRTRSGQRGQSRPLAQPERPDREALGSLARRGQVGGRP